MKSCYRFNSLARCLTIITVHPWVWLLQLTLDMWKVDRGGLELMSLWVRSGVLRIAKNSCRSNSARYPLFNTLDNSMPIDFNDFLINVQKKPWKLSVSPKRPICWETVPFKRSNSKTSVEWLYTLQGWSILCWKHGGEVLYKRKWGRKQGKKESEHEKKGKVVRRGLISGLCEADAL